jgi:hypothetical protein
MENNIRSQTPEEKLQIVSIRKLSDYWDNLSAFAYALFLK